MTDDHPTPMTQETTNDDPDRIAERLDDLEADIDELYRHGILASPTPDAADRSVEDRIEALEAKIEFLHRRGFIDRGTS